MRIKIVKYEARNAVNIGNIDKFRNEVVDDFKLIDAVHDLFRGSLVSGDERFNHFAFRLIHRPECSRAAYRAVTTPPTHFATTATTSNPHQRLSAASLNPVAAYLYRYLLPGTQPCGAILAQPDDTILRASSQLAR